MTYKLQHRSGNSIPTNSDKVKEFETKKEAKIYRSDYGLGAKIKKTGEKSNE